MPPVDFKGAEAAHAGEGQGSPIVLIHGSGGSAASWDSFVGFLAPQWTAIRPNLAGPGSTQGTQGEARLPLSLASLAEQVVAAADAAGARRFQVLGHSLGAVVAAQLAADHPDRVSALVLLGGFTSTVSVRQQLQFELWRDLIATDRRALARLIFLSGLSPGALERIGAKGIAQAIDVMVEKVNWDEMARQVDLNLRIDIQRELPRIVAPTLVIGCTHDQMVPLSSTKELAANIAGARYAEVATGHLAVTEHPRAVFDLAADFLRATLPPPAQALG